MEHNIGVGLASFGLSGRVFHAPLLRYNRRFAIKRIVERSKNEAQALYPDTVVSKSFDDLLHDDSIDLIVVNTPDQTHFEYAKKSLEAGKHVIVEKPFTQTVAQAEALIALAQKQRRVLSVFQNRRWDGDFLTVRQILERKLLGRLVDYESHYDRYRNSIQAETWKEKRSEGTGLLYNLGSHLIDQAFVLFGIPEAVTAHIKIVRTGGEVDDWFDVRLHYADVNVVLRSSYLVRETGPRFILHGTKGSFIKSGLDPQEEALKQGLLPGGTDWGKEAHEWWGLLNSDIDGVHKKVIIETQPGRYDAFYDDIYECITRGKEPAVKPDEALNVIRIIEAAQQSNAERRTVVVTG